MAIVESNLVQGYVLQNYFVDKNTSEALDAGVITLYKDGERQILKNWYYLDGAFPNYEFKKLPNPLTLSAIGTIVDDNGNNVIPFYYPFSEEDPSKREAYYITVDDKDGQRQFTVQDFPSVNDERQDTLVPTYENILINNRFWRNITNIGPTNQPITRDLTNETNLVVCPAAHDGFHEPDMRFKKDITGGADSVTFKTFDAGEGAFDGDIRPEYYLSHICTSQTAGDIGKYYQIPISLHLKTIDDVDATLTIWGRAGSVSENNKLTISIERFLGSASVGDSPFINIDNNELTLTPSFTKFTLRFKFPSTVGLNLPSPTADDAYFLRIGLPEALDFNVEFCLPSIYLSDTVPTNEFKTYDQTDSVINNFRTGDVRFSLNFQNQGWIPVNGGSIGSSGSNASTRGDADTWPLYNLLWNSIGAFWQTFFDNAGAIVPKGTTNALDDFNANKAMSLPISLGSVLAGANPSFGTTVEFTVNVTTTTITSVDPGTDQITLADIGTLSTGSPIIFSGGSLPPPVVAGQTYYLRLVSGSTIELFLNRATSLDPSPSPIDITGGGTGTVENNDYELTLASSTLLFTGTPVALQVSAGGSLPFGLSSEIVYYINQDPLEETKVKLCPDVTYAQQDSEVAFVSIGSGTFTLISALGAMEGAAHHTLTIDEMPSHNHVFESEGNVIVTPPQNSPSALIAGTDVSDGTTSGVTNFTGGSDAHSSVQATNYTNLYIKL